MGSALTDADEVQFRQIHPNFIHNGQPSSDRFKPQPNDAGLMSVDRASITTASAAYALYTSTGSQSAAVFGVTVSEFGSENIICFEDALIENPAHAVADYNSHIASEHKNISKRLTRKAIARGQLYP
jgi:hypothetical protein